MCAGVRASGQLDKTLRAHATRAEPDHAGHQDEHEDLQAQPGARCLGVAEEVRRKFEQPEDEHCGRQQPQ